jgi:hypothetical protein
VNGQIDATLADLLPAVQQRLGVERADDVDLSDLVNTRITGLSVVVTPAAVATVVPLSPESVSTTRAGRRAMADIVGVSTTAWPSSPARAPSTTRPPPSSTPPSSAACGSGTAMTWRS